MTIRIVREQTTDTGTPGILTSDAGFTCRSLELPWRNNHPDLSCIVADTYSFEIYHSPHLNEDVLLLEDKHGRTEIMVHNANWAGDVTKGWYSELLGCTAVGSHYDIIAPKTGKPQFAIVESIVTLHALIPVVKASIGPHVITYVWKDGCAPSDLSDSLAKISS